MRRAPRAGADNDAPAVRVERIMSAKPLLIGISSRIYTPGSLGVKVDGIWTKNLHYLEQSVAHWVLSGHAMAVMVPAVTKDSIVTRSDLDLDDYAATLDGLLLQGGNDWAGDRVRDEYEMELIGAFVRAGKPVFGICRGLQLLNVMYGGTLLQDIATQRPDSLAHRDGSAFERHFHPVQLVPGTRLAQLYAGTRQGVVNSLHHQAIKDLAAGFTVEALCPSDGTIEAIRRGGPGYIAAVQWHPEFHTPGDPDHFDDTPLLNDFLQACRTTRG
jgi:putative glutamine amidotransferase